VRLENEIQEITHRELLRLRRSNSSFRVVRENIILSRRQVMREEKESQRTY
jgi:hypothetical protein